MNGGSKKRDENFNRFELAPDELADKLIGREPGELRGEIYDYGSVDPEAAQDLQLFIKCRYQVKGLFLRVQELLRVGLKSHHDTRLPPFTGLADQPGYDHLVRYMDTIEIADGEHTAAPVKKARPRPVQIPYYFHIKSFLVPQCKAVT